MDTNNINGLLDEDFIVRLPCLVERISQGVQIIWHFICNPVFFHHIFFPYILNYIQEEETKQTHHIFSSPEAPRVTKFILKQNENNILFRAWGVPGMSFSVYTLALSLTCLPILLETFPSVSLYFNTILLVIHYTQQNYTSFCRL